MLEVTAINHEIQLNPGQMAPLIQGQPKSPLQRRPRVGPGAIRRRGIEGEQPDNSTSEQPPTEPGHRKEKAPRVNKPLTGMDLNELRFLIAEECQ